MRLSACLLILFSTVAVSAFSTEIPTSDLGKKLFYSTQLGSTTKSCASCHPDGQGLKETGAYSDSELREMINFCIRDALKGTMLPDPSQELDSLFLYVRHLGR